MNNQNFTLPALVVSLLFNHNAIGQTTDDPLEEIIVVANRVAVPAKQIGTSVSVLNQSDIIARGNQSLTDVVRQLPAVSVSRNGGIGAATSLRIRGEEGFRTLVRFDGLKLADPSGTQVGPQLQHVVSSGINRVEILRGPQGLSYGADAGGVMNITSRQGSEDLQINLDIQSGSFGMTQVAADVSGGNERADFFLAATSLEADGFNTRDSDSVLIDDDGYDNDTVHARVGINVLENLRVDLVHRDVSANTEFDGCFSVVTVHDCNSIYDLQASRIGAVYTTESISHSLAYSNTESDREGLALGVSSFTALGELERWEYISQLSSLEYVDFIFGFDLEEESNNGISRDNKGYYLEALSKFSEQLFLTAGVRQDDNDDFGEHTSYRVTGAYLLELNSTDTLKLKASIGTGFRAPAPAEIAFNVRPNVFPPASLVTLKEENSSGFEVGVEYFSGSRLKLEATYFDQEIEDAIFFDLISFSGYLQDIGTSTSQGVELSGNYAIDDNWNITANYTYNDTERPNGQQRRRRPETLANVGISYTSSDGRFSFNSFYRSSADSIDEIRGSVVSLKDFGVVDINASFKINEAVEVYTRIENFLDEEYQEIFDFNSASRGSYVGLRLHF